MSKITNEQARKFLETLDNKIYNNFQNVVDEIYYAFVGIEDYIKQQEKQEKLLELYKELATVRGDMLYCYEAVDFIAYNAMEKKETQLEKEIEEIENDIK